MAENATASSELGADAVTETEKAATARLGALLSLFIYGSLMCGTLLWQAILFRGSRQSRFLRELAVNECVDRRILRRILGGRFNLVSGARRRNGTDAARNPWLMAPLKVQIAVWMVGALAEETWRVTAIAALVTSRNSPLFSVFAVGVAFGSGYLSLGLQRAAVASLEGVFFGFLFLWQGSFLAPFTAHLAVQAVYLWEWDNCPKTDRAAKLGKYRDPNVPFVRHI